MLRLIGVTLCAAAVVLADDSCPAFGDFRDWSNECAWLPLENLRDAFVEGCDVRLDTSQLPTPPSLGNLPDRCGHCSFKFRCRKRSQEGNCFPLDAEKKVCDEFGDVCDMPKFPVANLGCRYEFAPHYIQQCLNRPDLEDWQREGREGMADLLPNFHCIDKDGQCKCCCHPYMPNADGSQCVEHHEPECEPFTDWTDWSEKCMWLPPAELKQDFVDHCQFEPKGGPKADQLMSKLKLPEGFEMPERCGYCSFKLKCRKREVTSAAGKKECFPLEVKKKACGPDDCDTCGDTCELPKLLGNCNYTAHMKKLLGPGLRVRMKKLPHGLQMGMIKIIANLPHGKCVEKGDKCHCCCHPYEPTADGTGCVLKEICKNAEDLGVEFDLNLPDDDSFFW